MATMRSVQLATAVCLAAMGQILAVAPATADDDQPRWRIMSIRSHAEFQAGVIGGEAEQHPHGMARSPSHPDIVYLSHDVGQAWRSDDNGRTWHHLPGRGLHVTAGQSIAVDPVDPDTLLFIVDNAWNYLLADDAGLYRSTDGGETWDLALATDSQHQRTHQENIAHAPGSVDDDGARRWYAGFPDGGLYRSDDRGRSWSRAAELDGHDPLYAVHVHPHDDDHVFVASSAGLFVSHDAGQTLQPLGDLPAGHVSSVRLDPATPDEIHATVRGQGLYRSRDGGASFEQIHAFDAMYVFIHQRDRDVMYLVGQRNAGTLVTDDGGATWHRATTEPAQGLGRDDGHWKGDFDGPFSAVLPDPRDPAKAVGYSRATLWRTDDGGRTFRDSSTLWTGYAWGWFTSAAAFDRHDPLRFAFFLYDVGMVTTDTGGDYFERHGIPWQWRRDDMIRHSGMYAGDIKPGSDGQVIVAAAGMYWASKLVRSEDGGATWQIVHDDEAGHLYVAFHPDDPSIVYAHDKRSTDGGRSFQRVAGLEPHNGIIVGMAPSQPDTVYAVNGDRDAVLRSDDRGETWDVYTRPGWAINVMDSKPTFRVHPTDPDRIYTIDRDGDLASFDGESWTTAMGVLALAGGGAEQGNAVRRVAIDPRHPEIIYAGTLTPGRPFLFRSTDAGETWRDISGNLGRIGAGGLEVHPLTGDVMLGGIAGTRVLAPPYESEQAIYHRLPEFQGH